MKIGIILFLLGFLDLLITLIELCIQINLWPVCLFFGSFILAIFVSCKEYSAYLPEVLLADALVD